SSPQFSEAVERAGGVLAARGLAGKLPVRLISNGSLVHQADVRRGLARLAAHGGELWFKLDSATDEGMRRVNDAAPGIERVRANLRAASVLLPTWIQTCVFARDALAPTELEQRALVEFLGAELAAGTALRGVLLYGLARPSHQPEAPSLARLPRAWLEDFAARLAALGLAVSVHP